MPGPTDSGPDRPTFSDSLVVWVDSDVEDYHGEVTMYETGWVQLENGALYPPHEIHKVLP